MAFSTPTKVTKFRNILCCTFNETLLVPFAITHVSHVPNETFSNIGILLNSLQTSWMFHVFHACQPSYFPHRHPNPKHFQWYVHGLTWPFCRNFSFGLATKARACKVASQEGSRGIILHVPGSVGKCEGVNPHTSNGSSTLRVGVPMASQIFREQFQGSKYIEWKISLYHWKAIET